MQKKANVTVLTCVYNGLPYLKEAIESTLNQTYTNFEYLIIDDCSPDPEVVKFIESYDDSRIRFVKNEKNLGVSETINKALPLITTPYVVRIDQDDVNLPSRVEEQIAYLENHPDIDIVCSWEHAIDGEGRMLRDWKRTLDNYGEFLGYVLVGLCPIWHPSIAFRTKSMIDAGGFKIKYTRAEDFEVTTRLALKRYGAAVVPKFHLLQRQHEASQSKEFDDKQQEITRMIHNESLMFFSEYHQIDELASFLRLENNQNKDCFNQDYLAKISNELDNLYAQIKMKQKMSHDELISLKKIINRRVGFGVKFSHFLTPLPSFLFYPIYYMLSPMQMRKMRQVVSSFYNKFISLRYFLDRS